MSLKQKSSLGGFWYGELGGDTVRVRVLMDQAKAQRQSGGNRQADRQQSRQTDLQRTQLNTSLAANRLAPPKSPSMRGIERQLARMSQERAAPRSGSQVSERLGLATQSVPGIQQSTGVDATTGQPGVVERPQAPEAKTEALVAADFAAMNAVNPTPAMEAPALVLSKGDLAQFSSGGDQNKNNPAALLQKLSLELVSGGRWIDVLWQFILANQKRVLDLDRLGIEPSERVDLQVDIIREIAASYGKLGLLTCLPASLNKERECKAIDDIRTAALVYVARKMMDIAVDQEEVEEKEKQIPEFPRSVVSPYEGIPSIEIDALALIAGL